MVIYLNILRFITNIFFVIKFLFSNTLKSSGCDTENKYQIFGCKDDGDIDKKLPLFKAKEKSDFCSRQFLSADCRPFKMKVEHEADNAVSSTDGTLAFSYNREC
jgi:hypothetical protein